MDLWQLLHLQNKEQVTRWHRHVISAALYLEIQKEIAEMSKTLEMTGMEVRPKVIQKYKFFNFKLTRILSKVAE